MEKLKVKIEFSYEPCAPETAFPVIVAAAGNSSRMRGTDKLFMPLCGMPVIARTLCALNKSRFVSRIILVTRSEQLLKMQQLTSEYELDKLTDITEGGSDRHGSVLKGIERLRPDEKKVLIHDGARPLVDDFVIGNVAQALEEHNAVICGVPVSDTVKRVGENGCVSETVDRNGLYLVQTPQGIDVAEYLSLCNCLKNAADYTDDAGIFEACGRSVTVVKGSRENIKITTPEDAETAELLLRGRGGDIL